MRVVAFFQLKLILYMDKDKPILKGKLVLFYILAQRCRGPPHAQNSEI